MSRSDHARLDDIRDRSARIARLVDRGRDAFDHDEAVLAAIERSLEVIGEAANATSSEVRATYPDVDWRRIIRLRILLAHHYHRVEPEQIWTIATRDVPAVAHALGPIVEGE